MYKCSLYLDSTFDQLKKDILKEIGYCARNFPFQYLGVPITAKKLSIALCWLLVERISVKITCWYAILWTYAGRLQFIKAVIFIMVILGSGFIGPKEGVKMY